jgi:sulfonate transport system permease protein
MNRLANGLRALALPFALLALYEVYARRAVALGSDTLAPPSAAVQAFIGAARDGSLLEATMFTLGSTALGLALGGALALLVGLALGLSRRMEHLGSLTIELLRPLPAVALIPLAMLMFGFGLRMEVSVIAFAVFWPLLILVQVAVRQVEPRLLEVSRVLGLGAADRVRKIVLPAIMPRLVVALRAGVGVALVVAVTVEVAANPHGVGYAMTIAQQTLDPALMLAWLGWVGVVGFAINEGMLWLQRAVTRRSGLSS